MKMTVNPNFVSVIRLTTSGIASSMGFDLEEIEDIKVAISEACTNAIKHSKQDEFELTFYVYNDKLTMEVKDEGIGYDVKSVASPNLKEPKENGLGLFIIQSLMDDVEINSCEECGTIIRITKWLELNNDESFIHRKKI
ncbi:ATP-binding protein [Peptostreptococcus faecalis]|uniref:ATP-binding protein n=1 Tax=Peptostreptococcus faecalis TaxID=2045015 RepID=UPI000C7D3CED